ncbi:hypothetical protein GUI12_00480 [Anaplasmataceae bacterium AB001_6]|nr:hypothetical protein GUI12_00480 [Anaplasmataceae bacterium AB001_6]
MYDDVAWEFLWCAKTTPSHLFAGCRDDNEEPRYILSTKINDDGQVINRYLFVADTANHEPEDNKPEEQTSYYKKLLFGIYGVSVMIIILTSIFNLGRDD